MTTTFEQNNACGSLCCKGCGKSDKQLNTFDWLADIPGNADETEYVEVQFKNTRKGYYRNSNKIPLEMLEIKVEEIFIIGSKTLAELMTNKLIINQLITIESCQSAFSSIFM